MNKDGSAKKKAPTEAEHDTCPGHAAASASTTPARRSPTRAPIRRPTGAPCTPGTVAPASRPADQRRDDRGTAGGPENSDRENKSWDSATVVRQSWMAESFLTRATAPKGAETFLATAVAHGEHTEDGHRLYLKLTGADDDKGRYWIGTERSPPESTPPTPARS